MCPHVDKGVGVPQRIRAYPGTVECQPPIPKWGGGAGATDLHQGKFPQDGHRTELEVRTVNLIIDEYLCKNIG